MHRDFTKCQGQVIGTTKCRNTRLDLRCPLRGDEPTPPAAVQLVGNDNFTWDSDYPHPDGTFPWGVEAMLKQPLSPDSKRKLLGDNAARVFNRD